MRSMLGCAHISTNELVRMAFVIVSPKFRKRYPRLKTEGNIGPIPVVVCWSNGLLTAG